MRYERADFWPSTISALSLRPSWLFLKGFPTLRTSIKTARIPLASVVELLHCTSQVSTKLRISSDKTMEIAESLYQRGYISYPRTETDKFKEGTDLRSLIEQQAGDNRWADFAQARPRLNICTQC